MMNLREKYKKEIVPKLKEKFGYKNVMQAPKIEKVVINVGFGRQAKDKVLVDSIIDTLTKISGQRPVSTKAKKAIASFKIRNGMVIGACVTLRGTRMYDFVDKLINVTLPRVRDFRGISAKSMDEKGNITIGFKEHICFPEISADEIENIFGLEVCIHSTAKTSAEGLELLKLFGFPFKDNK
ncbi:MAG: 50S ribosomal protein L5 [bacterium]